MDHSRIHMITMDATMCMMTGESGIFLNLTDLNFSSFQKIQRSLQSGSLHRQDSFRLPRVWSATLQLKLLVQYYSLKVQICDPHINNSLLTKTVQQMIFLKLIKETVGTENSSPKAYAVVCNVINFRKKLKSVIACISSL
jgi:hypothetical protein